jgi:hypothetical protein
MKKILLPSGLAPCVAVFTLAFLNSRALAEEASAKQVPVVFSGGYETAPVDHGRPVALVAGALGVAPEVFREAFSHVHPAGPGSGGPTGEEARANKAALMSRLAKYGITNDRLDEVSNRYRYAQWRGEKWPSKPASAYAVVENGKITKFVVTDGGYGYCSLPEISVPGVRDYAGKAELGFDKNFEKNGAIVSIAVYPQEGK